MEDGRVQKSLRAGTNRGRHRAKERERKRERKKERKKERDRETQSHNSAPRRDEAGKMRISQALNYVHSGTGTEEFE